MKEYTAEDVLRIAEAYAHADDWDVEAVYVFSLRRIVEGGQAAGYAPDHVVAHAKHTGAECRRNDCVIGADEEREREARS